jgi:hypothetical protein
MAALPEKLAKLSADIESGAPPYNFSPEINEIMHRATAELIALGQAEKAKKVGDQAPTFSLIDSDHNPVALDELLIKGPLVVTFYRGFW